VVVAYFGDGASNIGAFHEALNLAAVWKLPVIFVCQNNRYGEHTRYEKATSALRIADRAVGYNIPGVRVDGNEPLEVYAAAREAIERARGGQGPTLIEAMTFRFHGHVMGDADAYMDKAEKAAAMAQDPTRRFREHLVASGIATEKQLEAIEADTQSRIEEAVEFALSSAWPDPIELERDVLAEEGAT
jgi:pyruvate dehydrogenase E1 component alpha subunit